MSRKKMTYKTLLDMKNKCQLLTAVLLIHEKKSYKVYESLLWMSNIEGTLLKCIMRLVILCRSQGFSPPTRPPPLFFFFTFAPFSTSVLGHL